MGEQLLKSEKIFRVVGDYSNSWKVMLWIYAYANNKRYTSEKPPAIYKRRNDIYWQGCCQRGVYQVLWDI